LCAAVDYHIAETNFRNVVLALYGLAVTSAFDHFTPNPYRLIGKDGRLTWGIVVNTCEKYRKTKNSIKHPDGRTDGRTDGQHESMLSALSNSGKA